MGVGGWQKAVKILLWILLDIISLSFSGREISYQSNMTLC